ncbi:MAG: helix-turn-helix transcriptional regulator [Oscillospiraceae bacterium]
MIPQDVDFYKLGQKIKKLRQERGLTQADLSAMINCSNNHLSHIETAQCKVSLTMLLRLSYALEVSLDTLLLNTPYARPEVIISSEIAGKLQQCLPSTLNAISTIIDALLEQQKEIPSD